MNTHFFDDRTEQYKPADDSRLNPPSNVAEVILVAGCELRELVVCHSEEGSWP